jgi:transcriptional regulator with XRE-family HTH domain
MADSVGERLRKTRQARRLTIRGLAELAKVPPSTISEVESGSRGGGNLTIDTGKRLALALGVTLDYLAGIYEADEDDESKEAEPAAVAMV